MDKKRRQELIDQQTQAAEAAAKKQTRQRERAQVAHCEKLDALEAHGIDLDSLIEIYGETVLVPDRAEPVERLSRIIEAINDPASSTLIVGQTELALDDSVFDARNPARIIKARFALFEDPSRCRLEFVRDEPNQTTSLLIRGTGYAVSDQGYRRVWPDPCEEPGEIMFTLAQRYYGDDHARQILSSCDYDLVNVADEDTRKNINFLDTSIVSAYANSFVFAEAGSALKWFMYYNSPADRKLIRERNTQ